MLGSCHPARDPVHGSTQCPARLYWYRVYGRMAANIPRAASAITIVPNLPKSFSPGPTLIPPMMRGLEA